MTEKRFEGMAILREVLELLVIFAHPNTASIQRRIERLRLAIIVIRENIIALTTPEAWPKKHLESDAVELQNALEGIPHRLRYSEHGQQSQIFVDIDDCADITIPPTLRNDEERSVYETQIVLRRVGLSLTELLSPNERPITDIETIVRSALRLAQRDDQNKTDLLRSSVTGKRYLGWQQLMNGVDAVHVAILHYELFGATAEADAMLRLAKLFPSFLVQGISHGGHMHPKRWIIYGQQSPKDPALEKSRLLYEAVKNNLTSKANEYRDTANSIALHVATLPRPSDTLDDE